MKKKHMVKALQDGLLLRDLRDAVYEMEDTAPITEAINKRLPESYKIAPPGSIFVQVCGRGEREDLTDYRNWKAGDVVECINSYTSGSYMAGEKYIVRAIGSDTVMTMIDSKGEKSNGWHYQNFRFISRPDNGIKTWRVGDWVECIDHKLTGMEVIKTGDIDNVAEINRGGTSVRTTPPASWGGEACYRLVRRAEHAKGETPEPVKVEDELKEGDVIEITNGFGHRWWRTGNLHPVIRKGGYLGVYDLDSTFRPLPLAVHHKKVPK